MLLASTGLLAGVMSSAAAAEVFYDDFGRPDSTDLGPDWSEVATSDLAIQNQQLTNPTSSHAAAVAVGIESDAVGADVFAAPGALRYAGVMVGYASVTENVFVKVQDQAGNDGQFESLFVYRGVMGSFIGFANPTPFSAGHLTVAKTGLSIDVGIDTDFDGTPDQTFNYVLGSDTGGTGVGVTAYGGGRVDNFTVGPVPQTISFTAPPANPAPVGSSMPVQASASSGLAVVLSSLTPGTCTLDAGELEYVGVGTCTVRAEQEGNDTYQPAAAQVSSTVTKRETGVSVGLSASTATYGEPVGVEATVTSTDGATVGDLQAELDGTDVGAPVAYTGPDQDLGQVAPSAGLHSVGATFTPDDTATTEAASDETTLLVEKAPTDAQVTVDADSADVTVTAGFGTPDGSVAFSVNGDSAGTQPLAGGSASLPVDLEPGDTVSAIYGGGANYLASAASTAQSSPSITATLDSGDTVSAAGWYSEPVTVSFTCTPDGSPLASPCPAPVVLASDGALQTVQRSVTAQDGGVAVTSVQVSIDRTGPSATIRGLPRGPILGSPLSRARCVATDALSGVVSCDVSQSRVSKTTMVVTATATDAAGNRGTSTRQVTVVRSAVLGATFGKGAYELNRRSSYTLIALSAKRPYFRGFGSRSTKVAFYPAGRVGGEKRWLLGITVPADQAFGESQILITKGKGLRIPIRVKR